MKIADIPAARLAALNAGAVESATLTEGLAIDFPALLTAAFPAIRLLEADRLALAGAEGIARRMQRAGALLHHHLDDAALAAASSHGSDTVRGWVAYALVAGGGAMPLPALLDQLRPLADDAHFGVREWAWLAIRPRFAQQVTVAIAALAPWTVDPSPHIRRFASEATRPRGVWCAHIPALKRDPALGLPILAPLKADPAKYVQDSVGNWLNDAAKSQPDWVRALCADWAAASPSPATRAIIRRGLRSLDA